MKIKNMTNIEKMDWLGKYKERVVPAAEAARVIKSGDRVVLGHAAGVPQLVPDALMSQRERLRGVQVYHMFTLNDGRYMTPEGAGHFRHITNFVAGNSRTAVAEGRADFLPCFFYEVPALFNGIYPVDVAIVQVSVPDAEGFCSFGVACDYTKPAAEKAKVVIAEMNDRMPYIGGDNLIHISELDYIVPVSSPLYELPAPHITDVERRIGEHCASLVSDGDTLQLGIGAIPDAVLLFLKDKRDLGIHTEMFSDGIVELVRSGVVTGAGKSLHKGKLVATFLMGSQKLYDFADRNPDVELYPVDYVNDPNVISRNDHLISINSCIEMDLQGQVSSETIGLKQFSGTGGQVDYIRGAARSKGGKSIIAVPSTASGGKISRIVPFLTKGAAVTTSRNEVDYVVTEYGIAQLKGRTLKERAKALIAVTHPHFQPALQAEYRMRFGEMNELDL